MVRLFLALGHQAGLRPADLVGAIANEARGPGHTVGAIDIRDKVTFVEVAAEHADMITERMKQVTIRGRTAALVVARPGSYERGRGKPTPGRGDKPAGKKGAASGRHPRAGEAKPWQKFKKKR